MQLGYIGLGKMGYNMALRLLEKDWRVVAYNRTPGPAQELEKANDRALGVLSLAELVAKLDAPRLIWLMVSHHAVDEMLKDLIPYLEEGDTVIDGGNSFYKDSMRRAEMLESQGITFLDAGVSGGPGGARSGACVMIGGSETSYKTHEALFGDIAAPGAYGYMGKAGAGHFVKMVHNGIEYGMMQALAEGFAILKGSPFNLDLAAVADLYNRRSVIESRLVGWLTDAYKMFGRELDGVSGSVGHTGEGAWTVEAATEFGIPAPVIADALRFRIESKEKPSYAGRVLSALRNMFGGHAIQ